MRSLAVFALLVLEVASAPLSTLANLDTNLRRSDDICSLHFTSGDTATDNATWVNSGAKAYLWNLLKHNLTDWSDKFFEQTVGGGTQGGSTFDCAEFLDVNACQGPGETPCTSYTPHEAFYIHLSMSNLYGAFTDMYNNLTSNAIIDVGAWANELTNIWGPPPSNNVVSILLPMLVGLTVFGSMIASELATVSSLLVGLLNVASGLTNLDPSSDPNSFRGDLTTVTSTAFGGLANGLSRTIKGLFSGDDSIIRSPALARHLAMISRVDPGYAAEAGKMSMESAEDIISAVFAGGVMMDHNLVDSMITAWNTKTAYLIKDAMLLTAWENASPGTGGYVINVLLEDWQTADPNQSHGPGSIPKTVNMTETICKGINGSYWLQNVNHTMPGCVNLYQNRGLESGSLSGSHLDQLMGLVGGGAKGMYEAMITNAIECMQFGYTSVGGYPAAPTTKVDMSTDNLDFKNPPIYPKCFWDIGTYYSSEAAPLPWEAPFPI